jgi:acetolactate synthase-1/2/3 large subunit
MAEHGLVCCADLLVRRLRDHGVRDVFGYPGGQIAPIYDALYLEPALRHRLARHEQAACFMADGYARSTGRPGVCLAVCGPGVFNAFTPLGTAQSDSVPVLILSGQIPRAGAALRSGYYHENNQLAASVPLTKARFRAERAEDVLPLLASAWSALTAGRPGPVLFEVPLDVLREEAPADPWPPLPPPPQRAAPRAGEVKALARLVQSWRRPLIMAGGGVVTAGAEPLLLRLAERLGAPVQHTAMGKGAFPASHTLHAGLPWHQATSDLTGMEPYFSPFFREADGLLALGCRFTQLATGNWTLPLPASRAHIDVDAEEIGRHYPVEAAVVADLRPALEELLDALPPQPRPPWAGPRPRPTQPWRLPGMDLVGPLRRVLPPDAVVAADVTRLAYVLMTDLPLEQSRCFLHPAGSVAMGYALPAALGAQAAWPGRAVVAIVGDGGFLMSGMELATAVQEQLPVVVVLVNDRCLTLIKGLQARRYGGRFVGVDLDNPDFEKLAGAFGVDYWRADDDDAYGAALGAALAGGRPGLVEVRPGDVRGG